MTPRLWRRAEQPRGPTVRRMSGLDWVIQRAAADPVFRSLLLRDPRQAIAGTFGLELPTRFRLKFVEKDPDVDLMVVLPDLVTPTNGALDRARADDGVDQATGGAILEWLNDALAADTDDHAS